MSLPVSSLFQKTKYQRVISSIYTYSIVVMKDTMNGSNRRNKRSINILNHHQGVKIMLSLGWGLLIIMQCDGLAFSKSHVSLLSQLQKFGQRNKCIERCNKFSEWNSSYRRNSRIIHVGLCMSPSKDDEKVLSAVKVPIKTEEEEEEENLKDLSNEEEGENDEIGQRKKMPRIETVSAKLLDDNDVELIESATGEVLAKKRSEEGIPKKEEEQRKQPSLLQEVVPKLDPSAKGYNIVLTHCTADFDTLASAIGLAKLWSSESSSSESNAFAPSETLPTYVVLPRGAHPAVQKFLALHKHLFPIRSLKSFSKGDLSKLHRLGLVDAQRRERIGPAETLLQYADRITIVDHHVQSDSDIIASASDDTETDYIVESVGSVSTMIAERLRDASSNVQITEAEATLLALGIHADTGSLCFDSTTPRDAQALAWVMGQGASQAAIAEHAQASLSPDQQGVLTQALINTNSTDIHGVTLSTVLLRYASLFFPNYGTNSSRFIRVYFTYFVLYYFLQKSHFFHFIHWIQKFIQKCGRFYKWFGRCHTRCLGIEQ